jgi:hypothetical protein
MKRIFASLSLLCSLGLTVSPLQAATLNEVEPNNSFSVPQILPTQVLGDTSYTVFGAKTDSTSFDGTSNDSADYYQFAATAGTSYSFEALVTRAAPSSNRDTLLYLYDAAGTVLGFDDNSGVDFGSRLSFTFAGSGNYIVAVTGFGDAGDLDNGGNGVLVGGGDTNFAYTLTIAQVPEPSTFTGLLGLAAMGAAALMRRQQLKR